MRFSRLNFILAVSLLVVLTLLASGIFAYHTSCRGRILYGVQSEGRSLFGLTQKEAEQYFTQLGKKKLASHTVSLRSNGAVWKIQPQEVNLQPAAAAAAEEAYNSGREGTFVLQAVTQIKNAIYGCNIPFTASYDESLLQAKLEGIAEKLLVQPVNAACEISVNGAIHHIPGKSGKKLDIAASLKALDKPLKEMQAANLELPLEENPPFVRTEDVANVNAVLGTYTTYYRHGARGDNIAIATQQLNGVLIRSGANFSFNNIVGTRTANAGYKNAAVLVNGKSVPGIGGGVCQVSSTLYNAILLAGLNPTERFSHFIPSSYCPPGLDATVADNLIDFQFMNPLPHNVYILASADGRKITVQVLGTQADLQGKHISIETVGSSRRPSVYRIYSANGQVVEREYLHTDSYS